MLWEGFTAVPKKMDVWGLLFLVIWTSYTSVKHKVRFVMHLIDNHRGTILQNDFHFIYQKSLIGFNPFLSMVKLTPRVVFEVSRKGFNTADLDQNGDLDINKVMNWIDINTEFKSFCNYFRPDKIVVNSNELYAPIRTILYPKLDGETLSLKVGLTQQRGSRPRSKNKDR